MDFETDSSGLGKRRRSDGDDMGKDEDKVDIAQAPVLPGLEYTETVVLSTRLELVWVRAQPALRKMEYFVLQSAPCAWTRADLQENMDIYSDVTRLCTQAESAFYEENLYGRYFKYMNHFVSSQLVPCMQMRIGTCTTPHAIVTEIREMWTRFKEYTKFCHRVFGYLDRYYVRNFQKRPVKFVAFDAFRGFVFPPLASDLHSLASQLLESERRGDVSQHGFMTDILRFLLEMEVPDESFPKQIEWGQQLSLSQDYLRELVQGIVPGRS